MSLFESIVYSLISGFSELLPVSSLGHQAIMLRVFGVEARAPLQELMIHIGIILAIITGCRNMISRIHRDQNQVSRKHRGRRKMGAGAYEIRLIRSGTIPMLIVFLIYIATRKLESNMPAVALFFAINGLVLIIPEHTRQANKDASAMSGLDGIIMGFLGGLSALPGISRIGAITSYATLRGADRQRVISWAILLSVPVLLLMCLLDVVFIFASGLGGISFLAICGYILSAIFAYLGAYLGIIFIRFLTVRTGYTGFAYYSWGTALFAMILYLIV